MADSHVVVTLGRNPGKSITSPVKNILDKPVKRFHGLIVLYFEWSFNTVCIESRHLAKTINIVYACKPGGGFSGIAG